MTATTGWTLADAPRLDGRYAIVTGATGGLGYQTALGLARQGATTILAGRNPAKGEEAIARIRHEVPGGQVRFEPLDLASLGSVARFAEAQPEVVDILVNNGAVMALPRRERTEDGFERQIGVNYLAHFALTLRLRVALANGRVVNVASLAHRKGKLGLDDFQSETSYSPMGAYRRSKLAMLMFTLELQRRAVRSGWNLTCVAAHPGWARTDIIPNGIGSVGGGFLATMIAFGFNLAAQPASDGARPILFAAVAPEAVGGAYYGPTGWDERRGGPGLARIFPQAENLQDAARLWDLSERLTGVAAQAAVGQRGSR